MIGKQEEANLDVHYQTLGYHLLVAFNALTGNFLGSQFPSGMSIFL